MQVGPWLSGLARCLCERGALLVPCVGCNVLTKIFGRRRSGQPGLPPRGEEGSNLVRMEPPSHVAAAVVVPRVDSAAQTENIARIVDATGASSEVAARCLEAANGNLDAAVALFFDGHGDGVRPPDESVYREAESLIDVADEQRRAARQGRPAAPSRAEGAEHVPNCQESFDTVRRLGREQQRWIAVNLQRAGCPRCASLNKCVWAVDSVASPERAQILGRYLLWQRDVDHAEAMTFTSFYGGHPQGPTQLPVVYLIDPRTGRLLRRWDARTSPPFPYDDADAAYVLLDEFLQMHTLEGFSPPESPQLSPKASPNVGPCEEAMSDIELEGLDGDEGELSGIEVAASSSGGRRESLGPAPPEPDDVGGDKAGVRLLAIRGLPGGKQLCRAFLAGDTVAALYSASAEALDPSLGARAEALNGMCRLVVPDHAGTEGLYRIVSAGIPKRTFEAPGTTLVQVAHKSVFLIEEC